MRVLILILTGVFVFFALIFQSSIAITNPFFGFAFAQAHLILEHVLLFSLCFLLVFFFLLWNQQKATQHLSYSILISLFFQTAFLYISSIFFAFIALLVLAFIEVNSIAFILSTNPSLLGVVTNTKDVAKAIQKNNAAPLIIASEKGQQANALAVALIGKTTVYGQSILPAIPNFLIIPIRQNSSSLLFLDNTLIVTSLNTKDLQEISPLIASLLFKANFPLRQIPKTPHITVLSEKAFTDFARQDSTEKLAKVTLEIQKMSDAVSSAAADIDEDKKQITAANKLHQDSLKKQSESYDSCLSQGTYVQGVFAPTYTKDYCQQTLTSWEKTLEGQEADANTLAQKLTKDQQLLHTYEYYQNFFTAQKKLLDVTTNAIPSELGVFLPPNSIQVVTPPTNTHAIADYFETLTHEYLHYASYTPGKRLDSTFFEEGLTEYFARQVVQDSLKTDTNIGYPVAVKIMQELAKRISQPDLEEIYFSKDQQNLEKQLDLAYGNGFYQDNFVTFESLQYTADPTISLDLANTIMKNIGSKQLTEKDLFSTQSNL